MVDSRLFTKNILFSLILVFLLTGVSASAAVIVEPENRYFAIGETTTFGNYEITPEWTGTNEDNFEFTVKDTMSGVTKSFVANYHNDKIDDLVVGKLYIAQRDEDNFIFLVNGGDIVDTSVMAWVALTDDGSKVDLPELYRGVPSTFKKEKFNLGELTDKGDYTIKFKTSTYQLHSTFEIIFDDGKEFIFTPFYKDTSENILKYGDYTFIFNSGCAENELWIGTADPEGGYHPQDPKGTDFKWQLNLINELKNYVEASSKLTGIQKEDFIKSLDALIPPLYNPFGGTKTYGGTETAVKNIEIQVKEAEAAYVASTPTPGPSATPKEIYNEYVYKGTIEFDNYDFKKAIEWFDKALEINPKGLDALANKGFAYIKLEEYDKALESFDNALFINASDVFSNTGKGDVYYYQKDYEKAKEMYEKALLAEPDFGMAKSALDEVNRILLVVTPTPVPTEKPSQVKVESNCQLLKLSEDTSSSMGDYYIFITSIESDYGYVYFQISQMKDGSPGATIKTMSFNFKDEIEDADSVDSFSLNEKFGETSLEGGFVTVYACVEGWTKPSSITVTASPTFSIATEEPTMCKGNGDSCTYNIDCCSAYCENKKCLQKPTATSKVTKEATSTPTPTPKTTEEVTSTPTPTPRPTANTADLDTDQGGGQISEDELSLLETVADKWEVLVALAGLAATIGAALHYLKRKTVGEEAVEVKRGVTREGNIIKIGVKVVNNSTFTIMDVDVDLEVPKAFKIEGSNRMIELGNIKPGEFQSAIFKLIPTRCVSGKISGTVIYHDAKNNKKYKEIEAVTVGSICPFLDKVPMTPEQFNEKIEGLVCNEQSISLQAEIKSVHSSLQHKCSAMHPIFEGESEDKTSYIGMYSAQGAYSKKFIGLVLDYNIETKILEIQVYGEQEEMTSGLMAEIVEVVNSVNE